MIKLTKDKCFILVVLLCLVFVLLNSTTMTLTQVEVQKTVNLVNTSYDDTNTNDNSEEINNTNVMALESKENYTAPLANDTSLVIDESALLISSDYFPSNSNITATYEVYSEDNILDYAYTVVGFTVTSITNDIQTPKLINIEMTIDVTAEEHVLSLEIELTKGKVLSVRLYAINNEYGIYLSQYSEDDAREKYLLDIKDKNIITSREYEDIRGELSRRGVEEDTYSINYRSTNSSKDTYVSGNLKWKDDSGNLHPLRGVQINIYDYNGVAAHKFIGTTHSQNDGNYSFTFQNQEKITENGGEDIYIRIYPGDENAMVKQGEHSLDYYYESDQKGHMNVATGSNTVINATFSMTNDLGRAFQISQALLTARDFAKRPVNLANVTLRYPYDDPGGARCYYETHLKKITITGIQPQDNMPHPYASWDVIMHEYGHHVENELGMVVYGGSHSADENLSDRYNDKNKGIHMAYSEGWATCFGRLAQAEYSNYLTNIATVNDYFYNSYSGSRNYEDVYLGGESCEFSILTALWDIYDNPENDDDKLSLDSSEWWNVTTGNQCKTFSQFASNFYNTFPEMKNSLGEILINKKIAPVLTTTYSSYSSASPKFGGNFMMSSTKFLNASFILKLHNSDNSLSIERNIPTVDLGNTLLYNYTLSSSDWDTIKSWENSTFYAELVYYCNSTPVTGGYISNRISMEKPSYSTTETSEGLTITGTLVNFTGTVEIPEKIGGKNVIAIGDGAFENMDKINSIILPSTITSIGKRAFKGCTVLTSIDMSATSITKIEDYAFEGTMLYEIKLPQSVTRIGQGAFKSCSNIPNLDNITTVDSFAFENYYKSSVILPGNITTMGTDIFKGASKLTVFTEHTSKPEGWASDWNSVNRPVFWDCTFSANKTYLVSFNKTATNPININATDANLTPVRSGYEFGGWYTNESCYGTSYNNLTTAPNQRLYVKWTEKESCVAEGTLITLADGRQVPVESLTGNEMLLVWNLFTGTFDVAPILFIDSDPAKMYKVVNLYFSDGTRVKVISEHGLWDFDLNKYVFLREDAAKYVGHWFNKQTTDENGNLSYTRVQLSGVVVQEEYTTAWSPVTYGHLCYYVNGMLSMPGATTGLINIFDVDAYTMKIIETAYDTDIAQYGLFTYDEFASIFPVSEVVYEAFGGQYLKVAIGKGILTYDMLEELISRYAVFFDTTQID